MKKISRLAIGIFTIGLLILMVVPAQAVYIEVNPGVVRLYDDQVLGETDPSSKKEFLRERISERKNFQGNTVSIEIKPVSSETTKVEVKRDQLDKTVTVQSSEETNTTVKIGTNQSLLDLKRQQEAELEAERERVKGLNEPEAKAEIAKKEAEFKTEVENKIQEIEQKNLEQQQSQTQAGSAGGNEASAQPQTSEQAFLNMLRSRQKEEEKAQSDSVVQMEAQPTKPHLNDEREIIIKDTTQGDKRAIEVESGGQKSLVSGANKVVIESETGAVKVVGSTGKENILNNLPDEVVKRMVQSNQLKNYQVDQSSIKEMRIEMKDDAINHTANFTATTKYLGFIPQEVKFAASVNDKTGQVSLTQQRKETAINKLIDQLRARRK